MCITFRDQINIRKKNCWVLTEFEFVGTLCFRGCLVLKYTLKSNRMIIKLNLMPDYLLTWFHTELGSTKNYLFHCGMRKDFENKFLRSLNTAKNCTFQSTGKSMSLHSCGTAQFSRVFCRLIKVAELQRKGVSWPCKTPLKNLFPRIR